MRVNSTITVGADPLNALTGLATASAEGTLVLATRVFVQMLSGGTGLGYVMSDIPLGTVPSVSTPAHVTAQLTPASAGAPGGSYSDEDALGINIAQFWVHGANPGDTIKVSYRLKA